MHPAPAKQRRTTLRLALLVLGVVTVLSVAELTSQRFRAFTGGHSLVSTFIAESVLLMGVYLVIDEIIQRRETRRWSDVISLGIRALSTSAEAPAAIVRRSVDELAAETMSTQSGSHVEGAGASPAEPADYQKFVSDRADELADWLLAEPTRARSFAGGIRQSASRLEEAIIRWGPTLVEDPDSAELINLLPDIVDSARSAADAIAVASGRLDGARGRDETAGTPRGWTDGDRKLFEGNLLDVLKNADEFHRRVA